MLNKIGQKNTDNSQKEEITHNHRERVEQVHFLKTIFLFFAIMVLFLSIIIFFVSEHKIVAFLIFILFESVYISVLISYKNCWIEYDEFGFIISNFFGVKKRYSYEDVVGLNTNKSSVEIQLTDKKRIKLDKLWLNKEDFAYTICERRSKPPKKLDENVVGMSIDEIQESYENGKLKKALMVSEDNEIRSKFGLFKQIHYFICTVSIVISLAYLFIYDLNILFNYVFLNNILMLVSVVLYYIYPQYFTAREKAELNNSNLNISKYHKRCTQEIVALSTFLNNVVFLLLSASISSKPENNLSIILISFTVSLLLFLFMIILFKKFSWEYIEYRVGYVSYFVCHLLYCVGFGFMVYGLIRILRVM